MSIWSRKTIEILCAEAAAPMKARHRLPRSLGIHGTHAFGVGCTIGAGIFSLTAMSRSPGRSCSHLSSGWRASPAFCRGSAMPNSRRWCDRRSAYSYAYATWASWWRG